ncbi:MULTISPECIES: hypothetical protein [unclassified Streptomyces]|uniref:hypothetical protein n=1 Tax=unclassified Streptomyces TaxID=2593676 RepID=UPI00224D31C1|nr:MULTISPECIES: hypothetical protein [unclassified Streptomyces]MCX4650244.1 hypothetical protein [Streptomyces sp. NBC_01446]MCX5327759.1 hypothetical protein [Streptomyces sp. NBC_00120]
MRFRDRILLRLLDAGECAALLTPEVGDRLLHAAFTAEEATVGPVTGVQARQVALMPTSGVVQPVEAHMHGVQSGQQWRLAAQLPLAGPVVGADARLDLTLLAPLSGVRTSITQAEMRDLRGIADLDAVDARIVAEDGALPAPGEALQQRRLSALIASLEDRFTTSGEAPLGTLLRSRPLTFEQLLAELSPPRRPQRLSLNFVEDSTKPPAPADFPVQCLGFAVDEPFGDLAARLAEIQTGRARAAPHAEPPRPPVGTAVRTPLPALMFFPQAALDEPDLPGTAQGPNPADTAGVRTARLDELALRLRPLGIVPVAVP